VDYKNKSSGVWYGHVVRVKNKKIKNGLLFFEINTQHTVQSYVIVICNLLVPG